MAKKIVIRTRCFCCDHVEHPVSVIKPPAASVSGFERRCMKCGSYNNYRVSIRGADITIHTTFVRASKKGIEAYEKRTGKKYPVTESIGG